MALYAYRIAGLSKLQDELSQPGKIPRRPAIIGLHQNEKHSAVLYAMHQVGGCLLYYCAS